MRGRQGLDKKVLKKKKKELRGNKMGPVLNAIDR